MLDRSWRKTAALVALFSLCGFGCAAPSPNGYPRSYQDTIDAASREGALEIWSVTDTRQVEGLLAGFHKLYPRISVSYVELSSSEIYRLFTAADNTRRETPDFVWSSAMDLQIKLVNDGYAQSYATPERSALPDWAVWKDQAWGITAEPIVFAYNRSLIAPSQVPTTHDSLQRLIDADPAAMRGKLATYDPEASAVGFLYFMQDLQANRDSWKLTSAMGRAKVTLYPTTNGMLQNLADGKQALAFNMIGSYAFEAQATNPKIGVVIPQDYTLVMSRIAMIPAAAPHPNAAKLFLDYLLSHKGQAELALRYMTPVRRDVPVKAALRMTGVPARAIRVGPALLINQDRLTRAHFLKRWNDAMAAP